MILDLRDQLGNQLFAYASIKSVCMDTGQRFRWVSSESLLINSYDNTFRNSIDGGAFPNIDLSERISPPAEIRYSWKEPWPREHNYLPEIYSLKEEDWVRGHFQTPRYFADHQDTIRKLFDLHDDLKRYAAKQLADLKTDHPGRILVSMHLRRGWDYVRDFRVIDPDYYVQAVNKLCSLLNTSPDHLLLVVFSDVPPEAKLLKRLPCMYSIAAGSLFEDFALMQILDHHIVSNSTFSWWGAWLDQKDSYVLRPSIYPISRTELYPEDLWPDNWIQVEARREIRPFRVFWGKVLRKLGRK